MAFGERLAELRRANGLTQEAFAEQLNVSRQAVSKWESCRGYPEIDKILWICGRYGVSLDELFRDELPPAERRESAAEEAGSPVPLPRQTLTAAVGGLRGQPVPPEQAGGGGEPAGRDRSDRAVHGVFERRRRYGDDGAVDRGHHRIRRGGGPDRRAGVHLVRARGRGGAHRRHGGGRHPGPSW